MANRRQLVKRRTTVRNIRKITRTMQLIATARFQQAMNRAAATRPYADKLTEMVAAAAQAKTTGRQPLLLPGEGSSAALIVITSNRGLCGGYNANILRTAISELKRCRDAEMQVELHARGKKGINYFRFLGETFASQSAEIDDRPRFAQVASLADEMMTAYAAGELAEANVCYTRFVSTGIQRAMVIPLLPLSLATAADQAEGVPGRGEVTYDYLPAPDQLLDELLPAAVRMRLFQCFTDAAVSEQMARMVAMKAATDAAGDMIKILTRQYNRARQTAITMELLDIIGGVSAIS